MQPITYHKKRVLDWKDEFFLASLGFLAIVLMQGFLLRRWSEQDWPLNAMQVVTIALGFAASAGFFRLASPKRNSLVLDAESLTYRRGGQLGIWPWRALQAVTLERAWRGPRIRLTVLGGKNKRTQDGQWHSGRLFLIEDVWETPLDEIAAKLEEHRAQAVAAGTASLDSSAPE